MFPCTSFQAAVPRSRGDRAHLAATLDTIHLFGSAIDGGLKPDSDIDLLVTVSAAPNDSLRQALMLDLPESLITARRWRNMATAGANCCRSKRSSALALSGAA
ncbi:nucleotidyltransferase domain-containing protein [Escherichia coli]|uniref:nucleotidyltransferase domain-containing protein n=1 Tax=Escherichia coli TaxID=562 RepID=UPI003D9C7D83